ncbi:MAG: hypothetical protein P8L82_06520 [Paracoccaceae bacterium]|nr:hypothetical protein [Paracoccaceae bacterium]
MKRKHQKNDIGEHDLNKWGSPPFSRCIKISDLQRKRSNRLSIELNDLEKSNLSKFLNVTQIHSFQCTIDLQRSEPGWLVLGKINLTASQLCVITLEKVRTNLQIPLKRHLIPGSKKRLNESVLLDLDLVDSDPLNESVELGDIISEEIILVIPQYPRKKGAGFQRDTIFSENDERPNPFQKLSELKNHMEAISPKKNKK